MKTAIIGLGVIGKVHAEVCQKLNIEVVGLCDSDVVRAQETAAAFYPNAALYTDYKKMLTELKPDVVHICTPHYLHAEMVVECLQRDIHVLCEKPICINREQLEAILEAEEKSQAQLGVCHQNRYNVASVWVKEYLKTHTASSGFGVVPWKRDKAYYDSGEWRGKHSTAGGGVLINQALHTLDLLQYFLGMPKYCTATMSNLSLQGVIEVEDTIFGRFSDGSEFTFFATNACDWSYPIEISLTTEEGLLKISSDTVTLNGKLLTREINEKILGKACYGRGHISLVDDFYRCVQSGQPFAIDGKEAARVMRLIFAMYESEGRKIETK